MTTAPVPDADWLPALTRRLGGAVTVTGRAELDGGYASAAVTRVDLAVAGRALSVVVKPAAANEIAALRGIAVVPGLEAPSLLAAGPGWVVLPYYDGPALDGPDRADPPAIPERVLRTLALVHAHWLGKRPRSVPVADGAWWRSLCLDRIRPAVDAAGARTGDGLFAEVAHALSAWADDPRALAAAALVPRTLTHGDPHRGNILLDPDGGVLVDWGNARVAPPGFDLAVLRAQGATDLSAYTELFAQRTGAPPVPERAAVERAAVERSWSELAMPVCYLGFAADHLGAARVAELAGGAAAALAALGPALDALRT